MNRRRRSIIRLSCIVVWLSSCLNVMFFCAVIIGQLNPATQPDFARRFTSFTRRQSPFVRDSLEAASLLIFLGAIVVMLGLPLIIAVISRVNPRLIEEGPETTREQKKR